MTFTGLALRIGNSFHRIGIAKAHTVASKVQNFIANSFSDFEYIKVHISLQPLLESNFLPMGASEEIARNYTFLRPLVEAFPDRVPGGIVLTDVWLYLNELMDNKLLCKKDEPVQLQAANEASRCKRLMGALRYLYRNSNSVGWID